MSYSTGSTKVNLVYPDIPSYTPCQPRSTLFIHIYPKLTRGPFLESLETFRAHFGWHNFLCIFKAKASWGTQLCSYLNFDSLHNIWKDQLYRISGSQFYEWLFGPEKFSELSRNWPQFVSLTRPQGVKSPLQPSFGMSPCGGALRDIPKDGCEEDYLICTNFVIFAICKKSWN